MKKLLFVLVFISFGAHAQIIAQDHSSLSENVRVFPFKVAGITFKATSDMVSGGEEFHPQNNDLERVSKVHSRLVSALSPSSNDIGSTLKTLGVEVGSVEYQVVKNGPSAVVIEDYYENGQKVEGKIALRISILSKYDFQNARTDDSRFTNLYNSFVDSIQYELKNSDQYRAVQMLQESSLMLGDVGRAPAFVGDVEVVDGARAQDEQTSTGIAQAEQSTQR